MSPVNITTQVIKLGEFPVAYGDASDIWRAEFKQCDQRRIVAVKALRGVSSIPHERQLVSQQVSTLLDQWDELGKIRHANICPFYGVVDGWGPLPGPVTPYFQNGNVLTYIKSNPKADKMHFVIEIASALEWLHSLPRPVAHGNVKASNVMIGADGRAYLAI